MPRCHSLPRCRAIQQSRVVAAASSDHVQYTIRCKPHPVEYGQSLAIVSNVNDWDVGSAVALEWKEGDVWEGYFDVPLQQGVLEFKLVTVGEEGVLEWEGSENKVVKVFKKDVKKGATVECEWNSGNVLVVSADGKTKKTTSKKQKQAAPVEAQQPAEQQEEEEEQEQEQEQEEPEVMAPPPSPPVASVVENTTSSSKEEEAVQLDGDVVTYSFDGHDGETAAEMARRMYG